MFKRYFMRALAAGAVATLVSLAHGEPGVTDQDITLAMAVPLSGPNADIGNELKQGSELYFKHINDSGGIFGRKIRLLAVDDDADPKHTVMHTKKFAADGNVFALVSYFGTEAIEAVLPTMSAAGMPLIGAVSGADSIRDSASPLLFKSRASYLDEADAIITQLDAQYLKNIAVFYQADNFGKAGLNGATIAMTRLAIRPVAVVTSNLDALNIAKAATEVATANPQAVVTIAAPQVVTEFVQQMHKAGAYPQFITLSAVSADSLMRQLGKEGRGIGSSQVIPYPWSVSLPLTKQYHALAKQYGKPGLSYYGLEGFINAKLVVEALKKSGKNPTREKLMTSLEGEHDLGGYQLRFGPGNRNGSKFVEMSVIGRDGRILR